MHREWKMLTECTNDQEPFYYMITILDSASENNKMITDHTTYRGFKENI